MVKATWVVERSHFKLLVWLEKRIRISTTHDWCVGEGMMEIRSASDVAAHVAKETESLILAQLNEHISRGLIVIEQTQPQFVSHVDNPNKIEIRMSVRLKLKEQEYIERLERDNKNLKDALEGIYKRHLWHPEMGECICEHHTLAAQLLAGHKNDR